MKILERYVVTEFAKLLVMTILAFIMLFLMVDLFENMDQLMRFKVPLLASIVFFAYKVPFIVSQISPVAVLLAVLLSLGIFSRHGEITAIKAGGINLVKIITPLLIAGLLISVAVFFINESVTPTALRKIDSFKKLWFGVQGGTIGNEGIWLRTGEGIYNIRELDIRKKQIQGVTLFVMEKPFTIKKRVYSRLAAWRDRRWVADAATVWDFKGGEAVNSEVTGQVFKGLVKPEDLSNIDNMEKNMSFRELKRYVKSLERDHYEATRYRIDLYGKISFPLVNFIMVLVGIPFALKTGRHGGIAVGVGLSIIIAFSYWVIFAMTRSLGQSGMIPPLLAAAFPDMLFFAAGALMFGYTHT